MVIEEIICWWLNVDLDNSSTPMDTHIHSICSKFFNLKEEYRPTKIYMRENGLYLWLGESLITKGLPICFVKSRDAICV